MQYPVHRKQDCQNLNLGHGIPPTILCSSNMHQELASAKRILSFEARSAVGGGNLHRLTPGKWWLEDPATYYGGAVIWTSIATVERNWNITCERMPGVSRESYATSILNLKHFTWSVFGRQSINLHLEYVDPISWSTLRWQGAIPKLG